MGLVGDFVNNSLYRLGDVTQGGQAGNTLNGPQGGISGLPLNVPPFSSYAGIVSSITSQINLAVQNGQAYILANPRLVTRSGGTATFLAGGEVPIPVSAGFGAVSVTYKNYGVKLKIQPDVDHQGNILATVDTAISQINPALTVQGYPAFLTRKTDSVVNVHSGQTIVLSGLIHATGANSINKLPWLGDIPILGTLFRDTQFQHNQSELVIFVTPEVINPNSPANRAMIRQGRQELQNQGAPTTQWQVSTQQTRLHPLIFSNFPLAYQYGPNLSARTPVYWNEVTHGKWAAAVQNLNDFGDAYPTRRTLEADLIQGDINSGKLPASEGSCK